MKASSAELTAWCALDTQVTLAVVDGGSGTVPALEIADDVGETLPAAFLRLPGADTARWLVVVRVGEAFHHLRDGVRLGDAEHSTTWEPSRIAAARREPEELLADHLCDLAEDDRREVLEFLVEAVMVGASDGITTSHVLHRFREALRPRHRRVVIDGTGQRGGVVETLLRIDDHTSYLRGWLGWTPEQVRRVTTISPEGERVELGAGLHRYERPDVDAFYGIAPDPERGLGIAAHLTTVGESRLDAGWLIEVEPLDGDIVEIAAPVAVSGLDAVRDHLVSELALDRAGHRLCRDHLSPSLERLAERRRRTVRIDEVLQFGRPPADPVASVVVPLYRRVDLMEYQLGQFSLDASMGDVDLIYVLDSPEQGEELAAAAARWHRLYRQPFRLVLLSHNGGFSLANNLGVTLAAAPELVLCNSDVVPETAGWVPGLLRARDGARSELGDDGEIGAVGPMLLYEDDSLQHAGMYFSRPAPDDPWCNEHYFKGLHRSFTPAHRSRPVPAVTAACLLIETDRYRDVGGLSLSYVQGDYEDSDLCLRLAADGARCWYAAEVTLHHLEGGSYPGGDRSRFGIYNQWLHQHRWGADIERIMATGVHDPASVIAAVGD